MKSFDTWETELTKAGQAAETDEQKDELKKDAWTKLILEKKIGYFALLRNLRNIIEQAPEVLPQALELLMNENLIKKSLVSRLRVQSNKCVRTCGDHCRPRDMLAGNTNQ